MSGRYTFSMIKSDAVEHHDIGSILNIICAKGFRIAAMKMTRMSRERAARFYEAHKDQPFYHDLIEFMVCGPIVALVFEKDDAVAEFRKLIGSTDPSKAAEGTLRKLFAKDIRNNAVHGSDSDANAMREILFHFGSSEIYAADGHVMKIEELGIVL